MFKYANIFASVDAQVLAVREVDLMAFLANVADAGHAGSAADVLALSESVAAERRASGPRPPLEGLKRGDAVVPLHGVIMNRAASYMALCGQVSPQAFAQAVIEAADNEDVARIVLDVDSPGGTVAGTEIAALAVRYAASKKPVVAVANGLMASAAYWISSQATEIVSLETSIVGSIGAMRTHIDASQAIAGKGIRVEVFRSGPEKAVGQPGEGLTAEMRTLMQEEVDAMAAAFYAAVAQGRSMTAEAVKEKYGTGRTWIGRAALEAGLVDRIGTLASATTKAIYNSARGSRAEATTETTDTTNASLEDTDMNQTDTPAAEATEHNDEPQAIEPQAEEQTADEQTADEQGTSALAAAEARAAEAQGALEAAQAEIATLKAAEEAKRSSAQAVEASVNRLVASGRFTRAQAEGMRGALAADSTLVEALLAGVPEGSAPGSKRAVGVDPSDRADEGQAAGKTDPITAWLKSRD